MRQTIACVLLTVLCSACLWAAQQPAILVRGKENSRYDKMAVEELQLFWGQLYGTPLEEVAEEAAAGRPAIYLGDTGFALAQGVNSKQLGREEWLLKPVGNSLVVTGGYPIGTLYGVYRLLEQLGVAFLAPDETVVPSKPDFHVQEERRFPEFTGRTIYTTIPNILARQKATPEEVMRYRMWRLRLMANGSETSRAAPLYKGVLTNFGNPKLEWHTLGQYVDRKLFDEHPEYFMMDKGGVRRQPREFAKFGDICMTSPGARQVALDSLRKMIRENHENNPKEDWSVLYDCTRLDASPDFCQCPECRKVAEYEGKPEGLLVDFVNYLTREIRKEYPEILMRTQGKVAPPNKIKPEKGNLFYLADKFSKRDCFRPIEVVKDQEQLDYFDSWAPYGPNLMVWDYWNIYFRPPRIETVFDSLLPDFRYFRKKNIAVLFIEAEIGHYCPQNFMMLNYYVASRLMVNFNYAPEKLADEFIRGYYGDAAAPVMRRYLDLIREGVKADPQKATSASANLWKFSTPPFMLSMYQDLTAAAKAAAKPKYAARIHSELIAPIWCILYYWASCEKTFAQAGIGHAQLVDECRAYVKEYIRRYECAKPQKCEKEFEEAFLNVATLPVRPAKFKDVPDVDFRMKVATDFTCPKQLYVSLVDDPESIQGKAVKSAHPSPDRHGVDKVMPGEHKFRTTQFVISSVGMDIETFLKDIPQDEKYHWYRIPGSIEFKERSNFWGQGWAIQCKTHNWYTLTYGEAEDNTWDQAWFSAKFTGPAYVKNSTKENAIYVDMALITRGQRDSQFEPLALPVPAQKSPLSGWTAKGASQAGATTARNGKWSLNLKVADGGKAATLSSPSVPCTATDVFQLKFAHKGGHAEVGVLLLDKDGKTVKTCRKILNELPARHDVLLDPTRAIELPVGVVACQLYFTVKSSDGAAGLDDLEILVARELNRRPPLSGKE